MICLELFWTFFVIGALTFGGGYAMLPMAQEAVLTHGWLEQWQIVDFVAVSESTPGPFAVNLATYVGIETAGLPGALCATLGVVLPSFCIILIVARCLRRFQSSRVVKGAMSGLRPAVVGMIATAVLSIGQPMLAEINSVCLGIFLLCLMLSFRKLHPVWIVVISGGLGVVAGFCGLSG